MRIDDIPAAYRLPPVIIVVISWFCLASSPVMAESAEKMFERARDLAKEEDYEEAAQAMIDFQEEHPEDNRVPHAQFLVGHYEHQRNYLNTALKEYQYVLDDFPENIYAAKAMHKMADIYDHKEQYEDAIDILDRCAEEFEDTPEGLHALRRMGDIYHKTGDSETATETYQQLIQTNYDWINKQSDGQQEKQIHEDIRHGVMYVADRAIEDEDYETAKKAYLALPDMWERVRKTIDLYYMQEKFGEIHAVVNDMSDENYWQAQNMLLSFYVKKQSTYGIKRLIGELTAEHEDNKKLTELLSPLKSKIEEFDPDDQREILEAVANRYRPLRREYEFAICDLLKESEPEYLERFIVTYEEGDDVEQVKRWKGIYFELEGQLDRAHEEYNRIKDEAQAHFYIAESYHGEYAEEGGNVDRDRAIEEYVEIRQAFYNTEMTCEAYWRIANLRNEQGQKDEAVEVLTELEERFTGQQQWQVKARMQIADWLRKWEEYEDAIDSYRMVDNRYPKTKQQKEAVYRIGLCYEEMGNEEEAIETFLECVGRFDMSKVQSRAETRLEDKYDIPDLLIRDRAKEKE